MGSSFIIRARLFLICLVAGLGSYTLYAQKSAAGYYLSAISRYDQALYSEAIDFLDSAIRLDSVYEQAYFLRGMAFHTLRRYDLAIEDISAAIDIRKFADPVLAEYYLKRAGAHVANREYVNAEEGFKRCVEINPGFAATYYEWAKLKYILSSDKTEAIGLVSMAIQNNPNAAEYYKTRAEYKLFQARYNADSQSLIQSAIRDMTFAISIDTANYEYYLFRAELNRECGEPGLAIADYDKMISLDPDRYNAYTERGVIKMQNDRYVEAINDFSSAIRANPDDDRNFRFRGLCRYNTSDYRGAFQDFSSAVRLLNEEFTKSPDDLNLQRILADTYVKRGVSASSMGNTFNACVDFRTAYNLGSVRGRNYLRKYCGF
jgi:tetratricopeptide (TPR) repeat protein